MSFIKQLIDLNSEPKLKNLLKEKKININKEMNLSTNQNTCIMDERVPTIITTLTPTPFRRGVKSLRDVASNLASKARRKWKEFCDWLIAYVPQSVRVDPTSAIEKLKEKVKKLYIYAECPISLP